MTVLADCDPALQGGSALTELTGRVQSSRKMPVL